MVTATKTGLDDAFAQGLSLGDVESFVVDQLPDTEPAWEAPIPLDELTGPPFPLGALPGIVGEYAASVAEETQTPSDLAATVALGTLSAAAGGKFQVVIPKQGWKEPVHIQAVAVAEPGTRKSGIFRSMTLPIVRYERGVQEDETCAFARWESRGRVLEKAVTSAELAASKPPKEGKVGDLELERIAAVDALAAHQAERPRITRIITDDATPEAVKSLLAENGGAIAAMSAESTFLSNTAGGRYADAPNIDVLLNGHAGDSIHVDRKGRPRETIDRACLTLCLMLQPQVIQDLGKSPSFLARGGAARLLACFPEDMLGHRQIDVTPVSAQLAQAWSVIVTRLAQRNPAMRDGCYIPWSLSLDAKAGEAFRSFRAWHEPQMAGDGAFSDIRDWAGKQCGTVLRIAGLLHVAQHEVPENVQITAETVGQAITIVNYFQDHARIMYRLMTGRSGQSDARVVLKAIQGLISPTTRRDIHRKLHNRTVFAFSDALTEPLALLEEYGYIRRDRKVGSGGGRPSELITVNPLGLDDKSAIGARRYLMTGRAAGSVDDPMGTATDENAVTRQFASVPPDPWDIAPLSTL